jgi:hypothetical protein
MNSETYNDMLRNQFQPAIQRQDRGLLCSGECLQHDNGRHHTARQTVKQFRDFKLEVLTHTPYSSYFTPSDFYLFWTPKDALRGRHFVSYEVVKVAVHD